MRNLDHLIRHRIAGGKDGDDGAAYKMGLLRIIASWGMNWEHVSVSRQDKCPVWEEMDYIKRLFWDDKEPVMQLHPPRSQWVNNHPYCLHLWKPMRQEIPLPPTKMVGLLSTNIASGRSARPERSRRMRHEARRQG